MTRGLQIALALLVIGTGGLAALMRVPSSPYRTNSTVGALGGSFSLPRLCRSNRGRCLGGGTGRALAALDEQNRVKGTVR